jgi:hypothetical protein
MINLYIGKYKEANEKRAKEFDFCLDANMSNSLIYNIFTFVDIWPTYNDFRSLINKTSKSDDINIIANLDICFDSTLQNCFKIEQNECYCLTRWDYKENGSIELFKNEMSQDVWIFRGKLKPFNGDFKIGNLGCDNRIMYELKKAGYKISNPATKIKSIHYHLSDIRNYDKTPVPPPYWHVKIT